MKYLNLGITIIFLIIGQLTIIAQIEDEVIIEEVIAEPARNQMSSAEKEAKKEVHEIVDNWYDRTMDFPKKYQTILKKLKSIDEHPSAKKFVIVVKSHEDSKEGIQMMRQPFENNPKKRKNQIYFWFDFQKDGSVHFEYKVTPDLKK